VNGSESEREPCSVFQQPAKIANAEVSLLEAEVESVDRAINILGVPMRHSELFFSLKVHIDLVRDHLASRRVELLKQVPKAA
jgi:hypothetical protein